MKAFVLPLLDICLNHNGHDSSQDLAKQKVFASLFPGQEFIDGKLEKVMVEAHKVVRTGLLLLYYLRDDNEFQQGFDYSQIVRKRGLSVRYQHLLKRLKKKQEDSQQKNANNIYQQFQLENAIHDEESLHNQKRGDLNIPNVLYALQLHGQLNRLALLNRFLLQRKVAKLDIPETLKPILEENAPSEMYLEQSPALRINHAIFDLLKKECPESSDIRFLFDLLRQQEQYLDRESLQEFYTYLRNLCILVLSADIEKLEIEFTLHELYKDNLTRGYLHNEGKLLPSRYWAVSSNAVRVKEFDWAFDFIEKYKLEILGENESQDIYRLNLANYFFGIGHFSDCLDNIPPTFPFVDYLLTGKRLEIKAYYELKSELLSFKLDAFKVFLSRTSPKLLSDAQRQSHVDFANLLHQLTNSIPGDPKRSELLVSRIQEKKQSAEWRWLLEKAKELKEK
ncbi:MAG: hypothetical protein ACKVU0_07425 [Saprospiraceae bacterium]